MEKKTHKIKTTEDMLKVVTPENIDCFLKDFSSWLAISVLAKTANKEMGTAIDILTSGIFTWIDDGKNDVNIKVEVTNKT